VADHRIAERRSELREFCRELKQNARHLSLALASDVGIVPRSAETRDIGTAVALISFLISPQFEREYDLRLDRSNPIGCVGVILPYNSVFMTFAMSAAAAYLAGNTVLLRLPRKLKAVHAGLSELIGRCLPSMDLLDPSAGSITLSKWLNDPAIDCISCFGDNQWAYDYLPAVRLSGKKFIFEGPGKDPFIVFGDADLERAAAAIVATGTANSGQSCSSPERFYVERSVHQRLVDAIAARLDQLSVGPVEDDPDIGPIYSRRVVERIDSQLKGALSGGARLVRGGTIDPLPSGHGWIVAPTLLTNCGN
jgi:acyl-CoA reductase-like NAD-dependent aldehyde dehydrogenase